METRYCIEYVSPRHPLRDNGSINVRYDRVLTLEQAIHDLTLIKSFGAKILNLYMGNVVDGKTGEWNPVPMIVDEDDWFTTDWLKSLNKLVEVEEVDLEKEIGKYLDANDIEFSHQIKLLDFAKHFYELGLKAERRIVMKAYTDLEQSKKLAEILPLESADMWYQYIGDSFKDGITKPLYFPMVMRDDPTEKDIPAWSLSALLEIIRNNGRYELQMYEGGYYFEANGFMTESYFNPVDACYEMISKLHENGLL